MDVAKWRRRKGMAKLLRALGSADGLTRYVGGAVRDELLGLPVSDIDLATRLRPDEVIARLEKARIKAIPTGIDHGTVTAVSDGRTVEVTSLREDVATDGRRATIAYTDDWKADAARRDFTINALMADPETGEIFDYFGGLDDLRERRVRFIGDPLDRIAEDHLRILRFFRFHARFGTGDPDPPALNACAARANDLMALSRERIADELLKLLAFPDPTPTVAVMVERAILRPVLPEIVQEGVERLRGLVSAESESGIAPDGLRHLAALLPPDPELAERIAGRLRLSNKAKRRLACAVGGAGQDEPLALAYRVGTDCALDRLLVAGRVSDAARLDGHEIPKLPVRGATLIARGLAEGPVVARTLRAIEDRWVAEGFPTGHRLESIVSDCLSAALD